MSPFPNDPYCYPGTDVLINRENIRDQKTLAQFESQTASTEIARLAIKPIQGPFDSRRLQETHRRIFGNVYPWAGEFRQGIGMMTKERSGFVVTYGPSENVPASLASTFAALKAENELRDLDDLKFVSRQAYFYSELDAIHAFREGNSRTLRAFTSDLAQAAGHRLDWARVGSSPEDRHGLYHARDLAVMRGDTSELVQIIGACLAPRLTIGPSPWHKTGSYFRCSVSG
jgi:cell filamentation protein